MIDVNIIYSYVIHIHISIKIIQTNHIIHIHIILHTTVLHISYHILD